MAVTVVSTNGSARVYPAAERFEIDGYGDYVLKDAEGANVATRKRSTVDEIYVGEPETA